MNEIINIDNTQVYLNEALGLTGQSALKVYTLKLIQPTSSREDAAPGSLYDPQLSHNWGKKIQIIPLRIQPTRVLMPPREDGFENARPICKSNDGVNPVGGPEFPRQDEGRGCFKCEMSQWTVKGGVKTRPPCDEGFAFSFVHAGSNSIYRMYLKGYNVSAIKDFRTNLLRASDLAKALKKPFNHVFTMTDMFSTPNPKNKQNYILKFTTLSSYDDPQLQKFALEAYQLVSKLDAGYEQEEEEQSAVDTKLDQIAENDPPFLAA